MIDKVEIPWRKAGYTTLNYGILFLGDFRIFSAVSASWKPCFKEMVTKKAQSTASESVHSQRLTVFWYHGGSKPSWIFFVITQLLFLSHTAPYGGEVQEDIGCSASAVESNFSSIQQPRLIEVFLSCQDIMLLAVRGYRELIGWTQSHSLLLTVIRTLFLHRSFLFFFQQMKTRQKVVR